MTADKKPLVLDVDGTFLNTDMLFENFWCSLGIDPIQTLRISVQNIVNPALLKKKLAETAQLRTDLLPINAEIKAVADEALAQGREVILASASDITLVKALAKDYGLSDRVFASDGDTNLKGSAKAAQLRDTFGEGGYDYAGNEKVDMPIWESAETCLVVGDHPREIAELEQAGKQVVEFADTWTWRNLTRALRPHQYVKNVLLFLPMLAAHDFTLTTLFLILLGVVAFSAAASSIYIVNDLLDLEADRLHATKCRRPFAAGTVPIRIGMMAYVVLTAIALGIGALLGWAFFMVVVTYMVLSLAYSLRLKRMRWVDIAALASLYTLRVVAGAAAGQVDVSAFMLIFIFPIFITLGSVKRLTELTLATNDDPLPGRGYARRDRGDLRNMAAIGTVGALVVFFLYTMSAQAVGLYPTRWILWLALVPIAMWLLRMLRLGYFGKQDYDPIVFALRDKRGIGLLFITLSLMFYAAGLWQEWFGLGTAP